MKKKWIILIAVCVILVLGAVAALCWLLSPGVHFLGNMASFNLKEEKCFIISGDKVVDTTTMTFAGQYRYSGGNSNDWEYEFAIPGYTDIVEGKVVYDECFATKVGDRWTAQYHLYRDDSGAEYYIQNNQELMVIVMMDFVENKPVLRVYFAEEYDRDNVWAVCAESEEEALRIFKKFREQ